MIITVASGLQTNLPALAAMDEDLFWRAEVSLPVAHNFLRRNGSGTEHLAELPVVIGEAFPKSAVRIWVGNEYTRVVYVAVEESVNSENVMSQIAEQFGADEFDPAPDYFSTPEGTKAWRLWWD